MSHVASVDDRSLALESDSEFDIELWVLRSTLTLKTTDTTLMSVDGAIGQKGVLLYTCHMTVPER